MRKDNQLPEYVASLLREGRGIRLEYPLYLPGGRGYVVCPTHDFSRDENYLISAAMEIIRGLPETTASLEATMRDLAKARAR